MASSDTSERLINSILQESASLKLKLCEDAEVIKTIQQMAGAMTACLRAGGTIYVMGNGGSAADAQHIAGEMVGRFKKERGGYACVALTTDTSVMTSVGNDYGFEDIFARQVDGLVRKGDVVLGLSTSGTSKNVIKACELAHERGATVLGFSGRDGGTLADLADLCFTVPCDNTPRVQECHITVAHILCELVESSLCETRQ